MVEFLVENGEVIVGLLVALGAVVAAVVKLTPTKKDDEFVEKAKPFWGGFLDALRKLIGKK
jgi:hypothetical protein